MIRLEGVRREYVVGGRPVHALRGLDLTIASGEYVSVMGPSGSGKSTLLHLLGCLDRPTGGRYLLEGRDVGALSDDELADARRRKIGFVFQTFHLVPRLTAAENVELPMVFAGVPRADRRGRALSALSAVGLLERAHHRPDQLSGGERQRVALARAVVLGPAILLADEPTGNLDAAAGAEVIRLLEERNAAGITLLLVTHDPAIGSRAARRIRLADGNLVSETFRDEGAP
ncbi:MAG: ABC transporter ATP-binding protein [Acidobacteria bacterium]|nr:MAG: ABC transporter ATP-binding protein [Acidobacteriota bacterium]